MEVNLKAILLDSINSKHTIRRKLKVFINKKCYFVHYEMRGKYITFKRVTQPAPKRSVWQDRVQKRLRRIKREQRSLINAVMPLRDSETQTTSSILISCQSQTMQTLHSSKNTETDISFQSSRSTQTVRKLYRKEMTQTDRCWETVSTQSEWKCMRKGTQTEGSIAHASSQSELCSVHAQMQTEQTEGNIMDRLKGERAMLDQMVKEVGEMMLHHNFILQNNSCMLAQVSELMMLSQVAKNKRAQSKFIERIAKKRKDRQCYRRSWAARSPAQKCRRCHGIRKRAIMSQTDGEMYAECIAVGVQAGSGCEMSCVDETTQTCQLSQFAHVGVQVGNDSFNKPRRRFLKFFQS